MLKKNKVVILFTLICFSWLPSLIFAQQSDNGGLTGTVADAAGALVPNATVTVTNLGTNAKRTITTNRHYWK
ncbi:MAG: carboxypeptidase-like regulatory domain-containing protein [Pyrinomonadaceae bacterium]|nr:carboxypeptidase-like regulatory domain-containing protein [Pyrinomonadaceae bacterium]